MFKLLKSLLNASNDKEFGVKSITKKDEQVRSKAEKYIADYFFANNINYEYEKPFATGFWIFKGKVIKPDFYLIDYDVYVEYWGLLNDQNYRHIMGFKMNMYRKHRLKVISLYPNNLKNLNYYFTKRFKEVTGTSIKTNYYKWRE